MPRPRDLSGLDAPVKPAKKVPFGFVLDELAPCAPTTRPMFGCTAVYVGAKIVLILRDKDDADSGVWVATAREHHDALRGEIPSLRSIAIFGPGESNWQNIPHDDPRFEDDVLWVCASIVAGDTRIGRVPAAKAKRAPKVTAAPDTAPAKVSPAPNTRAKPRAKPTARPAARKTSR
ncbi:MAG: hypothetical protein U0325_05270 [Polyangiales bacterium]